jgi:hypothetical protein
MMKFAIVALASLAVLCAAEVKLGKPLTLKEPVSISALLAHPDDYAGKTVLVKGKISAVCQMMGCWMDLTDAGGKQRIHIDVGHGSFQIPKDVVGKTVLAEGRFTKSELTREQAIDRAREEAADSGRKFDPAEIKSGTTIFEIQGTGAIILD